MSAVEILLGATEPIGIRLRRGATLVTGATVRARVLRSSDGKEFDWSTNTFVTSGTAVQPRQALTETPASSGLYEYAWNTGTIANPITPDTYLVEFDETAPTVRTFIRQSEIRVRAAQSISAAVAALPTAASNASAVWSSPVPGAFLSGSAGFVLGTNLNAAVSSRAVPGDLMGLVAGAITAAKFATDAVDANAFAQGAADKVWSSATRTLSSGAITSLTFAIDAIDANALAASAASEIGSAVWATGTRTITGTTAGAITAASFAANALAAVWDELTAAHVVSGSFGLLVGTNLDATVSSRATVSGVWSELLPGAYVAGTAGFNLDVAVSTRATAAGAASSVWSTAVPGLFAAGSAGFVLGTNLDALVSSRAVPGDAMALTPTERLVVQALILSDATPFQGARIDAAVSSRATVAGVWGEAVPGAYALGSAGFVLGTNLDALVSSRSTVAGVWSEPLPGAYGAGQAGFYLDAQVTSRATAAGASAAVWGAGTRTLTSVVLDAGSLTASTIGAGYVAAVQAGLATSAQVSTVPGQVWDELLSLHTTVGSAGSVLSNLGSESTPAAIAAAVWSQPLPGAFVSGTAGYNLDARVSSRASPGDQMDLIPATLAMIMTVVPEDVAAAVWNYQEGTTTMGRNLALLRRRTTNRRKLAADGTITFYDDAGLPEKTAHLTDVLGGPIVVVPGDPAESSAET